MVGLKSKKNPVSSGVAKITLAIADPFWRHIGVIGMHETATDLTQARWRDSKKMETYMKRKKEDMSDSCNKTPWYSVRINI